MDPLLTGGGYAGALLALAYVGRLVLDWVKERKTDRTRDQAAVTAEKTAAVVDASTANGVVLATLLAIQAENERQQRKIKHLEAEAAEKDARIEALTDRLTRAQEQIQDIAAELEELRHSDNEGKRTS